MIKASIDLASEIASQIQRALIKEGVMVSPSVRIKVILPIVTNVLHMINYKSSQLEEGTHNMPRFKRGDKVIKKGAYIIPGEVRGFFFMTAEEIPEHLRYVVVHKAEGGGRFAHIYGESQLELSNEKDTSETVSHSIDAC